MYNSFEKQLSADGAVRKFYFSTKVYVVASQVGSEPQLILCLRRFFLETETCFDRKIRTLVSDTFKKFL